MYKTINEISDWEDLQKQVEIIFTELGYRAKVNERIDLNNGAKVNVDVLALKGENVLSQKILIECKLWNSSIPRSVVQSLKMDVQEAGANYGIIISKQGFQSGSYEGIALTTVKLLTFEELQKNIADEWMFQVFAPLKEKYNILVDFSRNFEYNTVERATFEKFQINDELKKNAWEVQNKVNMSLAFWKDWLPKDIYMKMKPTSLVGGKKINVTDTRSFANEINILFDETFNLINSYNDKISKLSPDELKIVFDQI